MSKSTARADFVLPFHLEGAAVSGRLVRLGPSADAILSRHDYPAPIAALLGETLALSVGLAGALKYDGVFTLQTKGNGPVSFLVADVTSEGNLRGYAQFDPERVPADAPVRPEGQSVPTWLGAGHLAFTVDQGSNTERYQGIVALEGSTLAECAHHYFRQSEQVETAIKVAVDRAPGGWRAAALFLQRLPAAGGAKEAADDRWLEALSLMATVTGAELADFALAPNDLLFRLFHEKGVRVYPAKEKELHDRCRCSEERVVTMLRSFPRAEIESLKKDGHVEVVCEFCRREYRFDESALDNVYAPRPRRDGRAESGR
ncbi:MAG TPA: Hsp33 family molecular chaperone HslO [Alphaproteobacteria bacterium]|nr:Hsp33 family molecular chaperone HslO [Alphaproteobacteria bacterium]